MQGACNHNKPALLYVKTLESYVCQCFCNNFQLPKMDQPLVSACGCVNFHKSRAAAPSDLRGTMMSPALHPAISAMPFFPRLRITAPRDHLLDLSGEVQTLKEFEFTV